jgi:hypothetical protein
MTESAESNQPTLVKPRSTWLITPKTSPMNPIEPLGQVYTHPWSTLGQSHGQTPLKNWRRRMSSGTFAAFSKIHLNTSKSTFMKVAHLVEGHNFHVETSTQNLKCQYTWKLCPSTRWTTFIKVDFEVFRWILENAAKVPDDIRRRQFLSGVWPCLWPRVDHGWV